MSAWIPWNANPADAFRKSSQAFTTPPSWQLMRRGTLQIRPKRWAYVTTKLKKDVLSNFKFHFVGTLTVDRQVHIAVDPEEVRVYADASREAGHEDGNIEGRAQNIKRW